MSTLETDYLIIGAGAVGIGFADTLVAESQATVTIVDERNSPGGHWNDAYPFVRLHHPSHFYGVASRALGDFSRQRTGFNTGLLHQATAPEILDHYQKTMEQHLLPSGRVTYRPMSRYDAGTITSLLTGKTEAIRAKKIVDATLSGTTVPATHKRPYELAGGVTCIPSSDLGRVKQSPAKFCVVGSGKTGMDAVLWLLDQGVSHDRIRWIMPRDAWWIDRAAAQFSTDDFATQVNNIAGQMEAMGQATDVADLFVRLEACGGLLRLDKGVQPTMFHGATISRPELAELQRIKDIVRLGRVTRIEASRILLAKGEVPAEPNTLYIDCSAAGFAHRKPEPVFQGNRIALQMLKSFAPTFSAALLGHIEATYPDDAAKNALSQPVPTPRAAEDWLIMMAASMGNQNRWSQDPALMGWILKCRLDPMTALMRNVKPDETDKVALLQRSRQAMKPAAANMPKLIGEVMARAKRA
jgi:Pyridine nucleotide-disulphide oxidoreductase